MAFNLDQFRANGLQLGGVRPTQFMVNIFLPFQTVAQQRLQFAARAASLPPAPVGTIRVPYMGRDVPYVGDREFPDWTITVYNDEDFALRRMFENWSNKMNAMISNRMDASVYPTNYFADGTVTQFGKDGSIAAVYKFVGMFPSNIDAIPLDWDAKNQIEQFDVTFSYAYWVPDTQGSAGPDDFTGLLPGD